MGTTARPQARPPSWLLDEVASAGRENLDEAHVARYDVKEDSGAAAEVAFLQGLGLDERSVVVDLGAGTGQFTAAVARVCARVVAVDVSPVMLRSLRSRVLSEGLANVEVVQAGFLTYDLLAPAAGADVAYSRYALHHLPDFWKSQALVRVRALLRPGGVFRLVDIVYDFDPAEAPERIEAWCATGGDESDVEAAWSRAELEEHVRDEHSTYTWLLEPMIERAGFTIEASSHTDDGIFASYVLRAV